MASPPPGHIAKRFNAENELLDGFTKQFVNDMQRVFKDLEKRLKTMLSEYAAGDKSKAIDIEFALEAKTQLQQSLRDAGYYSTIDNAIAKYADVIKDVRETYGMFGAKVTFSEIDRRIISELINTDMTEWRDLGRSVQTQIYKSLTDSVLGGVDINQGVEAVGLALANTDIAKHAYTLMNTSYMNFNRRVNNIAAENTGWAEVIYMGPIDEVTRPFCREHVNKVITLDEAKALINDQGGNAYTEGGGYNCRHRWIAVEPSYKDSPEYADLRDRTEEDLKDTQ